MGSAVCGSRLFMFGGEGPTKDGIVDYEELFELAIDEVELTVDFRLAKILPGATPGKRAAIGMVSINK